MAVAAVGHLAIAAGAAAAPILQHVAPGQGVQPAAESASKQNGPSRNRAATGDVTVQPALKPGRHRAATADIAIQPAQEQPRLPHPSRDTAAVPPRPLPTAAAAATAEVVPKKASGPGAQPTSKKSPPTSRSKNRAATADILIQPAGDVHRGRAATTDTAVKPAQEQPNELQPNVGASAPAAAAQTLAQPPAVSRKPAGVLGFLETAVVEVAELGEARTIEADAARVVESGVEDLAEAAVAKIAGKAVERALQAELVQWSSATTAGVTPQPVASTQSGGRRQRAATTEIAAQPVPPLTKPQRRRTLEPTPQMSVSASQHPASDNWLPEASEPPAAGKEPSTQVTRKPARNFNRSRSAAASSAVEPLQKQQTRQQRAATADVGSAPAQPSHSRFSPGSRTVSAIQESEDPEAPGSACNDGGSQRLDMLPADTSMQQPGDLRSLAGQAPEEGPQAWEQDQSEVLSEVESIQGGLTDDQPHAEPRYAKAYSLQGSVTDELDASEQNTRSDNNQATAESVSQQDSNHVGGRRMHSLSVPGAISAVSVA